MEKSNINGESNIYPSRRNPLTDRKFVSQIEDYEYIKDIDKMQKLRQISDVLTQKQKQILVTEMRCVYAKHDPCWGYINGEGIRCKCIESECPNLIKCNPQYTLEEKEYWTMSEEEKERYGDPDKQRKYYLVDLVSDEERSRYVSEPKGIGREFSPMANEKNKKSKSVKQKSDRTSKKKLVIIGYEDIYFGDADNQLSPIWGYIDDSKGAGAMITHYYGNRKEVLHENAWRIETELLSQKKKSIKTIKKKKLEKTSIIEEDKIEKKLIEKEIKSKLQRSCQLTEITNEYIERNFGNNELNIILSNEAEMEYVSSMFLKGEIAHTIQENRNKKNVCLWDVQAGKIKSLRGYVLLSKTIIEKEYNFLNDIVWEKMENVFRFDELIINGRDFFEFEGTKGEKRWGCRNLYGMTHIAIREEDLLLDSEIEGEQEIVLIREDTRYGIWTKLDNEQLGMTSENLWNIFTKLKNMDEILEYPNTITGLVLTESNGNFMIKGIGHMKFDEY